MLTETWQNQPAPGCSPVQRLDSRESARGEHEAIWQMTIRKQGEREQKRQVWSQGQSREALRGHRGG